VPCIRNGAKRWVYPAKLRSRPHVSFSQLLSLNKWLWNEKSTVPNFSSTIQRPFRCKLPEDLPPSLQFDALDIRVNVKYSVEVQGIRAGTGLRNKTLHLFRNFSVFPAPTRSELLDTRHIRMGWGGPWKTIAHEQKMRRGIFGSHSTVNGEVNLTRPIYRSLTGVFFRSRSPMSRPCRAERLSL
jgi:hypothetical protein